MEAKRKRTKNIIIAAVLVAVAILMAALPAMLSSGQKEENTGTAKSVAVQRGDIDSTVAGAGTLLPIEKAAAIVRNYTAQAEEKSATETKYEATLPLLLEDEDDAE